MKQNHTGAIAALIGLMLLQGCLFTPRTAEPPAQGEEEKWITPINPKDVFLNLKSGFASQRESNYAMSLDPSFTFIPRPEDAALLGAGAFADWTKDVELQVLRRIKSDYPGTRTIQFGEGKDMIFSGGENVEPGRGVFDGPYVITLDPGTGISQTYAGKARFTVINGTQGWVLVSWEDYDINGNNATSGWLRGTLRSSGG